MKEQLISKETAVLAKEKGFNINTINYYTPKGYCTNSEGYQTERLESSNWNDGLGSYPTEAKNVLCSAPTQGLLQKWLREKHNLYICISAEFYKTGINHTLQILCYNPNLSESDYYDNDKCTGMYGDNAEFNTYEEALEFGLQKALKLI